MDIEQKFFRGDKVFYGSQIYFVNQCLGRTGTKDGVFIPIYGLTPQTKNGLPDQRSFNSYHSRRNPWHILQSEIKICKE